MPFDPETGESTYVPYGEERLTKSADYSDITGARDQLRGILGSGIPGMQEAYGTQLSGISGIAALAQNPTLPWQAGMSLVLVMHGIWVMRFKVMDPYMQTL